MCAYDVLMKRPHALTQLLVMEMVVIQRAIVLAMTTRNFILATLSSAVVQVAMKDCASKSCSLCGFGLDNVSIIPFRQSIEFCLRKLYMKEYCQTS